MSSTTTPLSGNKYGHLTLVEKSRGRGPGKSAMWWARCDCGSLKEVDKKEVLRGRIRTCGICQYARRLREIRTTPSVSKKRAIQTLYGRLIYEAGRNEKKVELSPDQFIDIIRGNCYFCEANPNSVARGSSLRYNHVSRLELQNDYTLTNCIAVCPACKKMTAGLNASTFLDKLITIYSVLSRHTNNSLPPIDTSDK
jgi:hypothetical protein